MREKILGILEKNARIRTKDLAAVLGESEADVAGEIEQMEQEKVICGYNTIINWEKAGMDKADAFIEVKVTPQRGVGYDQIAERIWQYPEVDSLQLISGNFDFAVIIRGKSMRDVARFVSEKLAPIEGVTTTSTQFILKSYKDHGFVVENAKRDERIEIS